MKKRNALCLIAWLAGITVQAATPNEWTFETDSDGLTLSACANSGVDGVAFSADVDSITQTDGSGGLVCSNEVAGVGDFWVDGAVLIADVTNQTSGVRFFRYDLDYDLSALNNDSGTLLGLSFSDGTATNLAGVCLKRNETGATREGVQETVVATIDPVGSIAVVAKLDLDTQALSVWYNLFGEDSFNASNDPNKTVTGLELTTIDDLQFRATGDCISSTTNGGTVFKNIRTADSWKEIILPPADYDKTPELTVIGFSDVLGGVMDIGETNILTVVVQNAYSPVANVYTVLTHDGDPGDFTIVNRTPSPTVAPRVAPNRSITNTYEVIANKESFTLFRVKAMSDETESDPAALDIRVGSAIFYQTNSISGNAVPGIYQPGDMLDVEVISIALGAYVRSNIVNTLTAVSSGFTITPPSDVYASLDPNVTTSTVYQVQIDETVVPGTYLFNVVNSAEGFSWEDSFTIDLSFPPIDDQTLEIIMSQGEVKSGSITLTNNSQLSLDFSIRNDKGGWLGDDYAVATQSVDRASFMAAQLEPETVFTNWDGSATVPMDLEFDFHVFGGVYTDFSVTQQGRILLHGASGTTAWLTPYASAISIDASWIRYRMSNTNLVVAWGVDPSDSFDGGVFQAWLNQDGTIRYFYESGMETGGGIAVENDLRTQNIVHTPGVVAYDSLWLTPTSWVSVDPEEGTIASGDTREIIFTADAANELFQTNSFSTAVEWSNGQRNSIDITVMVLDMAPALEVPNPFDFSGPLFTKTTLMVTNTGNASLPFTLMHTDLVNAGYDEEDIEYSWNHIVRAAPYILEPSDFGSRTVGIGFPFTFFGLTRTSLVVYEDGLLEFYNGAWTNIVPGLEISYIPGTSSVRVFSDSANRQMTVTWEDMSQLGVGVPQTFQTVLNGDGTIQFNYQQITRDVPVVETNDMEVTTYTTNDYGGNTPFVESHTVTTEVIVTNVVSTNRQYSTLLTPGIDQVIYVYPSEGTIAANGGTMDLQVCGDAREAGVGVYRTTLDFDYMTYGAWYVTNGSTVVTNWGQISTSDVSVVTFAAQAGPVPPSDMWGGETAISTRRNSDGSQTLSWAVPSDWQTRTYTIWYTTRLSGEWQSIEPPLINRFSYTDDDELRNALPVIYYKVTVE